MTEPANCSHRHPHTELRSRVGERTGEQGKSWGRSGGGGRIWQRRKRGKLFRTASLLLVGGAHTFRDPTATASVPGNCRQSANRRSMNLRLMALTPRTRTRGKRLKTLPLLRASDRSAASCSPSSASYS